MKNYISIPILLLSLAVHAEDGAMCPHHDSHQVKMLNEKISAAPDDLSLRSERGQHYLAEEKFDKAAADFQFVLTHQPESLQAHLDMAKALVGMDKTAAAQNYLQQYIEKASSNQQHASQLEEAQVLLKEITQVK
ncbi:tetratricopeptide repeat protein [Teredinibacter sp. KSP-S5-2]|uniref:tetratricopeptide repeat protein n=1 Tax=Teredinibacter sp. KSP-S5-2 TaxID=3034506 RepID=UPI0029352E13|nr:tetratricopeptide repeat protein [Teredinibacter sp. KSP-S5-2]WNO11199.1 tetratricopeptide repeat protein [Teredinibacter sp. KSP-S5-2]